MNNYILSLLILLSVAGCGSSPTIKTDSMNCSQFNESIVNKWPGDGNTSDLVSNNNGLIMNGATFATGLSDKAFSFDGADDYVIIRQEDAKNPTSAITVTAWVKVKRTNTYQSIVSKFYGNYTKGINDDSYGLMIAPNGGLYWQVDTTVNGRLRDNILITNPVNIFDNQFHLIIGSYDGSSMKVYFDGQEVVNLSRDPKVVTGSIVNSIGTPILLGSASNRGSSDWFFSGLMDEINIHNMALTQIKIVELFNSGSVGICK